MLGLNLAGPDASRMTLAGPGPASASTSRFEAAEEVLRLQTEVNEKELEIVEIREQYQQELRERDAQLREREARLSVASQKFEQAARRADELEAVVQTMGSLRSELEIERERSMKLNQEVQQLQARFSMERQRVTKVVEEKGARSTELEERVSELSALLDQWKSWGQKRHEEARKLKASVLSLKGRLSASLVALEDAEQERDRLRSTQGQSQDKMLDLTRREGDTQSRLDAAELKAKSMENTLKQRDAQLAQLRSLEVDLQRRLYEEQIKTRDLSRDVESARGLAREKDSEARALEARAQASDSTVRELQSRLSDLSVRVERLKDMAAESSRLVDASESRLTEETRRREEWERKAKDLDLRVSDLSQRLSEREMDLHRERAKILQDEKTRLSLEASHAETKLAIQEMRRRKDVLTSADLLPAGSQLQVQLRSQAQEPAVGHPGAATLTVGALEEVIRCKDRLNGQQSAYIEQLRRELASRTASLSEARGKLVQLERTLNRTVYGAARGG